MLCIMSSCSDNVSTHGHLQPTDTYVQSDMEERKEHLNKKAWLELIHNCAPDTDWKQIEYKNTSSKYESNLSNNTRTEKTRMVNIDNGTLIAEWEERGSRNQAGSITKTTYDSLNRKLYAMADGGSIWKGGIDGLSWEVVIDELRFDKRFLEVMYPNPQSYNVRIIAAIAGIPHYYEALTGWRKADGFSNVNKLKIKHQIGLNKGQDIFFLADPGANQDIRLYHSSDGGLSYNVAKEFSTSDLDNIAMDGHRYDSNFYLLEQKSGSLSFMYKWNKATQHLDLIQANSAVSFGSSGQANLEVVRRGTSDWLYIVDGDKRLMRSTNSGSSWQRLYTFGFHPWEGGLFVSRSNPNLMMICEVNAHISRDGGRTWRMVNHWAEYYSNISVKLHADIMDIQEYNTGQNSIITVSNHGGISTSYNSGNDFGNIGTLNLNISQYYSVRTHPTEDQYIFAGSQDQGLQKTLDFENGTAFFEQMYAGDFGHLTYTNQDKSLWTVFPGGLVSYFANPTQVNTPYADYTIVSQQESVWLPPITANPNVANGIFLAGGNINQGQNGSHLIELEITDIGQLFINQFDFDFSMFGGEISAIGTNSTYDTELYVMTTNGQFFKSINGGKTFNISTTGLTEAHHLYGHKILSSENYPNNIIISGSGYDNAPVYISTDRGESFSDMSVGLPQTTVFDMAYSHDENLIFAATEAGPYVYIKNKERWYDISQGKSPNQAYWSVEVLEGKNKVRYGTYGRGIWDFNISINTATEEETIAHNKISVYPNPTNGIAYISENTPTSNCQIISTTGQLIDQINHTESQNTKIDLTHYEDGIYYLIFDDGNKISSQILVKYE